MNLKLFTIPVLLMIISSTTTTATVWATNQSSFEYGYMNGSLKDPQIEAGSNFNPNSNEFANLNNICLIHTASVLSDAAVMPAVTNTTACEDGFFAGYKDWCIHHAVDCVENMTIGDFPDMILKAHDQLLAGENAANGSGNSMCPIGNNAVFCNGWDSNNGDYGGQDCSDSPLANISYSLMGCAQDIMTVSQIGGAGLHTLVGTWNYVNESKGSETKNGTGISGKIVYVANVDNRIFRGYWQFSYLSIPNTLDLCKYNVQDHGEYLTKYLTKSILSGCTEMTVDIIDNNHLKLHNPSGDTIYLARVI
jgi:hypothetical protein